MVRASRAVIRKETARKQVPEDFEQWLRVVLQAIGYWGQSSSLASFLGVTNSSPAAGESVLPLSQLDGTFPLRPYFSCLATEFRSDRLSWCDIVLGDDVQRTEALRLEVYVWPMITEYRHGAQKLLVRAPPGRQPAVRIFGGRCEGARLWGARALRLPTRGAGEASLRYLL